MDLYTIPCKKNWKTIKSRTQPQFDLQIMGRATPMSCKNQDSFYSTSRERRKTSYSKQRKDKSVGCDLFENALINKTFQYRGNNTTFEFHQPRVFTPDIKVLRKKKDGKVVFQPIARMISPSKLYENPTIQITSFVNKTKPKVRRVINLNFLRAQEKDPFFSEKQNNLYDFVYNCYL